MRLLRVSDLHANAAALEVLDKRAADDHTVTARAVGTFFALLARGELVSLDASARMIERLERQHRNDGIPAELPRGPSSRTRRATSSARCNDAGLIEGGPVPLIFVALTEGAGEVQAQAFIAAAAALAYQGLAQEDPQDDPSSSSPLAAVVRAHVINAVAAHGGPWWTIAGAVIVFGYAAMVLRRRREPWSARRGSSGRGRHRRTMAVPRGACGTASPRS